MSVKDGFARGHKPIGPGQPWKRGNGATPPGERFLSEGSIQNFNRRCRLGAGPVEPDRIGAAYDDFHAGNRVSLIGIRRRCFAMTDRGLEGEWRY